MRGSILPIGMQFNILYFSINLDRHMPCIISQTDDNIAVELGKTATITVTVSGTPDPSFEWKKDGSVLPNKYKNQSSIVIHEVRPDDGGVYQCTIANTEGSVKSKEVVLTVAEWEGI